MLRKLSVSFFVLALSVYGLWLWQGSFTSNEGEVVIELRDEGTLVRSVTTTMTTNDTLFTLLKDHFEVVCATPFYTPDVQCSQSPTLGRAILGIDDSMTDWQTTFFQIRLNGVHANFGVDMLVLDDGDIVTFDRISVQTAP